ncbi:MAG TPA: cytochrome b N-terminal domain-containing protein [Candidatus Saccharimonadales bacterium]|nr:cytochrome b N-terminal domain-containing protein [Candidatus Saccharimonadales bacterium]
MSTQAQPTAAREFLSNLRRLPRSVKDAWFRLGHAPASEREESQATFHNLFLHIHSVRTHVRSLAPTLTLGLGLIAASSFVLLCITGVLLMVYYKPSTALAYDSIKDLHYVVFTGRFIRNLHRWSAHLMVVAVFLHMARVFYTASYKRPREFNWLIGLGLLVATLALSFTGYLLPYDQLAYWAITIGSNIANSPRELTDVLGITKWFDPGGFQRRLLLGANYVGEDALIRFYVLHVFVLPAFLIGLLSVHFWRIRKDGGLARPEEKPGGLAELGGRMKKVFEPLATKTYGLMALVKGRRPAVNRGPENTVMSWPHLFWAELAVFMLTTAVCLVLAFHFDAPLKELANPAVPENPAKAPWYFLGLQELVSYSAFMGGLLIPLVAWLGLALIPFLDRRSGGEGVWFGTPGEKRVAWQSSLYGLATVAAMLAFTVRFGWLRNWYPHIRQAWIIAVNPGSILVLLYAGWSLAVLKRRNSVRLAAVALFTCFLVGFTVLTYFATVHRGPNWRFYWWPSQWPVH